MKPALFRKFLAVLAVACGAFWLMGAVDSLSPERLQDDYFDESVMLFLFVVPGVVLCTMIGVIALIIGIKLLRNPSVPATKGFLVLLYIHLGLFVSDGLMEWEWLALGNRIAFPSINFAVGLLGVVTYPLVARKVILWLGMELTEENTPRIGRGGLILLAWLLWFLLSDIAGVLHSKYDLGSLFTLFFLPIAMSYGAYRYASAKLGIPRERMHDQRKHLYAFEREGVAPTYPPGAKPD